MFITALLVIMIGLYIRIGPIKEALEQRRKEGLRKMARHEWDHNKPEKGYSVCYVCGLKVKTYRYKKGGLPSCDEVQSEEYKIKQFLKMRPLCTVSTPPLACMECKGRIRPEDCDIIRREWGKKLVETGLIIDLTH